MVNSFTLTKKKSIKKIKIHNPFALQFSYEPNSGLKLGILPGSILPRI